MKKELIIAAVLGAVGIVLGAFGAHSLEGKLSPDKLDSFDTGIRYLMYHVIASYAITGISYLGIKAKTSTIRLFLLGILLFSGSIFLLISGIPAKFIWFITPLGGVVFVFAWVRLVFLLSKSKL